MFNRKGIITYFLTIILSVILFCGIASDYEQNNQIDNSNIIIEESEEPVAAMPAEEEQTEIIEEEEEKEEEIIETTMYTTTAVNIRLEPNVDCEILKTVPTNTTIIKIGEDGDWTKIKIDDNIYYIKSVYLSTQKTEIKITSRSGSTNTRSETPSSNTSAGTYLGTFKLTAYCGCSKCCGKNTGITASGAKATAGVTIAASSQFAFGTKLSINGHIYTVQDRGGAITGNKIDIYFDSHSEALAFGVKNNVPVYKVN
jgi:3D (Asp-Asp-Asp) domain-containing protein